MKRDSRHSEEIQISIYSGTKWYSLQSLQSLKCPMILKHLVTAESSMKERQNTIVLAAIRTLFHPERGKVGKYHSDQKHFLIECGGKDIFLSTGKTHDIIIYNREQLCGHFCAGRRSTWIFEHTRGISQLIQEAKVNKKYFTVVWLDLTNAYGTIPHT